ncbi:MAG: hypothetical protein JNM75_11500, partial [Rhodospirillales bacterium]|nr:hypothetical protein [Rhodospirillales bacterium]
MTTKTQEAAKKGNDAPIAVTAGGSGMDVDSLINSFHFHLNCTLAKDQYVATNQDRYHAL